jgi:uncharacterized membrane protein YbhN (UPF0104 family)
MRRLLILSARILVSLALLYLALRGINFTAIHSRLSQINVGWIALALLITVVRFSRRAMAGNPSVAGAPLTDFKPSATT